MGLEYDAPTVNGSADVFQNNSELCLFNSSGCAPGRLIQFLHASSGFGTSALPQLQLSVVQGASFPQICDKTAWISDSSIHCLFSSALSPEFRSFEVVVGATGTRLSIQNPFYIPAPPLLTNQTVQFRIYRDTAFPQNDNGFLNFGTTTGFQWPDSSVVASVQYSEVMTFSVLFFVNASQMFLDSMFSPIQTDVSVAITIWNALSHNVTALVLCDKVPSRDASFSLPPKLFWARTKVSLTFCTPSDLNEEQLRLHAEVQVRNLNGNFSLNFVTPEFVVYSSGTPSINLTKSPSQTVSASTRYDDALAFRFYYGTQLDDTCELGGSGTFTYRIELMCAGETSEFRRLHPQPSSISCLQNVNGLSFIRSSKSCYFIIFASSQVTVNRSSQMFEVVPGTAKIAVLMGAGPFCASAGAIVWSMNSTSEGFCLVAQLTDAENNNISSAVNASAVARSATSSHADYVLSRTTVSTSSVAGVIKWCDLYSSKQQNDGVILGANVSGNITYWTSNVINVSSTGPPANMLPNITAAINNQTLLPKAAPMKLTFSLQDAGGNPVSGAAGVAVRVRVVPRKGATLGRTAASVSASPRASMRLLLQAFSCESDLPLEFVVTLNPNSNQISAGPEFLCRAGTNDIFFDIGTVANNLFAETFLSVFTMSVNVIPGKFESHVLVEFPNSFVPQTFTLIDSLEVMFLDSGLNEVSGNATMSLSCINRSVSIYPSESFTVTSNFPTSKAFLPPFFLHVLDWMPTEAPFVIGITTSNASIPSHGSSAVTFQLNRTCSPGHRINIDSFVSVLEELKMNRTKAPATCTACSAPQYSSWYNDATQCVTLRWPHLPHLVQSGQDVDVSGVLLLNEKSALVKPSAAIILSTSLVRENSNSNNSHLVCQAMVTNGVSQSCKISQIIYQQSPGSDYKWLLEIRAFGTNVVLFSIRLPLDGHTTVLDFAPFVKSALPVGFSFAGGDVITLFGVFPPEVIPEKLFVQKASVPALFDRDACVFTSLQATGNVTLRLAANRTVDSNTSIVLECSALTAGASGPPFTMWVPTMSLADGRNSTTFSDRLASYCPIGFYVESTASAALKCRQCPQGKSITMGVNQMSFESCVCNVGHYGSFGDGCIACPKIKPASEGFNCSLTNQHPRLCLLECDCLIYAAFPFALSSKGRRRNPVFETKALENEECQFQTLECV